LTAVDKRTVLFIAGWSRSGSTILGNILGQLPGFCYVGELSNIWTRGVLENAPCGCGTRFRDCPMWQSVFQRAFGGINEGHAKRMLALRKRWPNNKGLLLKGPLGRAAFRPPPESAEYADTLRILYEAIAEYADGRTIVDSSKVPSYAFTLGSLPNIDLRLVHLVRDPRATSFSWLRDIKRQDAGRELAMERLAVWKSSAQWTSWNATTAIVIKLLAVPAVRLSYETFVKQPRQAVLSALDLVQDLATVEAKELPFANPHEVELRPTHSVWGNPRRWIVGRVPIVPDDEWNARLSPLARFVVAGLTYPLARQYGYYGK
jgi:hypothetical protein